MKLIVASLAALLGIQGCAGATPGDDAVRTAPAAAPQPTATAASEPSASATAAPGPTAEPTIAPPAPASGAPEAPKPPPASTTRKGVIKGQLTGTPLAFVQVVDAALATCSEASPVAGASMLDMSVFWKPGTYDINTKTKTVSAAIREHRSGKWMKLPDTVTGSVHVQEAPIEAGKVGRIHVKGERAGQPIDEVLEVLVCVALDLNPPKRK